MPARFPEIMPEKTLPSHYNVQTVLLLVTLHLSEFKISVSLLRK